MANFAIVLIASLLYLLNFATGSDYISLLLTLSLAAYLLFTKRDVLLPMMLYLSFFSKCMIYGSIYLSFFVVLAFFLRIIMDGSFKASWLLFSFALYFLIHILSTSLGHLTIGGISEILSFFLILPAGYAFSKSKTKDCVIYFITGFFISTLFGFTRKYLPRLDLVAGDKDVTLFENMAEVYRFSGISNDSNFYAILAIITLFVLLYKVNPSFQIIELKNSFIIPVLSIATFVFGVITYSKSFVVCALFLFAVYYIRVKKFSLTYSIAILFLSVLAFYFFSTGINEIEGAYMVRFGDDSTDIDVITSNRSIIWAGYFKDISNFTFFQTLFGAGMVHEGKVAAHNTYIQLYYEFGLIGFLTNLLLLYKSKKVFVKKKLAKYSYVIIALMAVLFFNLSGYTFSSTWAVLTIMFICCSDNNVLA